METDLLMVDAFIPKPTEISLSFRDWIVAPIRSKQAHGAISHQELEAILRLLGDELDDILLDAGRN